MLETIKYGLGAAALLFFSNFPFVLGDRSQGTLNWPLSPLSECPARTVNYITETSPPQCQETARIQEPASVSSASDYLHVPADRLQATTSAVGEAITTTILYTQPSADVTPPNIVSASDAENITSDGSATREGSRKPDATSVVGQDNDGDSPLDTSNFLSFEEWKTQNLAKAGQSVEAVEGRPVAGEVESRRRPGNIANALDSLGEDTEIELDFGSFVGSGKTTYDISSQRAGPDKNRLNSVAGADKHERAASSSHPRGKDAGKTCKERFNYASFDCAATVLKTNKESKGSTSVLVENKDSYMLNKCSADNKFFIVELCEDILVDTIVLANFEFFSSMFRTFRVSVSDRYPVKLDKWRELGTFVARNSREVQAFLVASPLIWARYLRVEFLAHYGNEYYCPVSLLRVHGTTMMEEFNHDMKAMREEEEIEMENGEEEDSETLESESGVVIADALKEVLLTHTKPAEKREPNAVTPPFQSSTSQDGAAQQAFPGPKVSATGVCLFDTLLSSRLEAVVSALDDKSLVCPLDYRRPEVSSSMIPLITVGSSSTGSKEIDQVSIAMHTEKQSSGDNALPDNTKSVEPSSSLSVITSNPSHADINLDSTPPSKVMSQISQPSVRVSASSTQPQAANPTTQESFFKSVHKRLQLLESNSTLSLQYIEEQSRILRDAFSKVEKRQLAKARNFLESLNTTVISEIHAFRDQYDHIWQLTVLELSSQREQSRDEVTALSARLSVLADEIVFQKRMAILQSVLILLCLGLVIFSRASSSSSATLLQGVVDKSSANLARYAHFETPRSSPSSTRPPSRYGIFGRGPSFARSLSEESDSGQASAEMSGNGHAAWNSVKGPVIEYSPPTPTSSQNGDDEKRESSEMEQADNPDSGIERESCRTPRSGLGDILQESSPRR